MSEGEQQRRTFAQRVGRALRPSHEHSAFSATLLLMTAVMASRVIGYLREAYIAYAFGAGAATDAYVAAFTIPDWLNYLLAGGTVSITFISIYTRYTSQQREKEAEKTFSVILTVMTAVLIIGIILAEIFTRPIERAIFPKFTEAQLDLCVYLTRILLPAQLFFYAGGIVSAVAQSHRRFLFPALSPLIYNAGIIAGGVLLAPRFGITSLAIGAVAGSVLGPFLVNAIGAAQTGIRYRPSFDTGDPGFREWVRLTIPLMLGVTLVAADEWILRFFASGSVGDIARLNYAKRLFAVPLAILGQAAGQASMPFYAKLFGEGKREEFDRAVNESVFRVGSLALIASSWLMVVALPLVDLVYRRGRFEVGDTVSTGIYFGIFSISLVFWSAQGLYARAFYAAGDTATPMIAGTIITILSLPVYRWLFQTSGVIGLAIASDIGIVAHTVVLAALLHRRGTVRFGGLPWFEFSKALAVSVAAVVVAAFVLDRVGNDSLPGAGQLRMHMLRLLLAATVSWAVVTTAGLWLTRSRLLEDLRQRFARIRG